MRKRVSAVLLLVVLSLPLSASILQRGDDPTLTPINRVIQWVSLIIHTFDDPIVPKP